MAIYLDTSALAKLVIAEAESQELFAWLGSRHEAMADLVTCDLARTELLRLVRRHVPARLARARDVLDTMTIMSLDSQLFEAAARMDPVTVRSLDALHLAAALDLGDSLDVMVCYDRALADAARGYGIRVATPGVSEP